MLRLLPLHTYFNQERYGFNNVIDLFGNLYLFQSLITQRQLSSLSDRCPVTTITLLDNTEVFNAVSDRMWHDHMFFLEVFIKVLNLLVIIMKVFWRGNLNHSYFPKMTDYSKYSVEIMRKDTRLR